MSLSKFIVGNAANFLEDFRLREKAIRTLQYGLLLLTPYVHSKRKAFETIGGQLSDTRVVLRLFDDFSMLQYTLHYGWGRQESNPLVRMLQLINNVADQLYFLVDHFAWAKDVGLLSGESKRAWKLALVLWAISLVSSIIRSLIRNAEIQSSMKKNDDKTQRKLLSKDSRKEILKTIMLSSDLLNALNWLSIHPWGSPFPTWMVGLLGVTSSLIGVYNIVSRKK